MNIMSKADYDSVDLTEDEDSRDTVIESEIDSDRTSRLPPLIPIPRVSLPLGIIDNSVPELKKIKLKTADSVTTAQLIGNNASPQAGNEIGGKLVLIKKNNKLYKIVIPHNVMPTAGGVGGPVVINIPEVGPLVIKIDPKVKKQPSGPVNVLEPFALNFDDLIEKASTDDIMKEVAPAGKVLNCWSDSFPRTRREHASFSGFSKRERNTNKRCLNQIMPVIRDCKKQLEETKKLTGFACFIDIENTVNKKLVFCLGGVTKKRKTREKKKKPRKSRTRNRNAEKGSLDILARHKNQVTEYLDKETATESPLATSSSSLGDTRSELISMVIENIEKFSTEMAFEKPLLIMNENHLNAVNFAVDSNKSNVIYPVGADRNIPQKLLESRRFSNAVLRGYVKLVDYEVLYEYFRS